MKKPVGSAVRGGAKKAAAGKAKKHPAAVDVEEKILSVLLMLLLSNHSQDPC